MVPRGMALDSPVKGIISIHEEVNGALDQTLGQDTE